MLIFELYEDAAGAWRWRAKARNGRIIADSGEGYTRKQDAMKAAGRFVQLVQESDVVKIA